MASYDRKFQIIAPDLTRVFRRALPVSDPLLVNPSSTSPLAFIDGEFAAINTSYQLIRATDPTKLAYALIDDRGDGGPQGMSTHKLSICQIGGYEADTIVFDSGLTTLGAAVMIGNVTLGGTRTGLVAQTSTNLTIGYVTKLAASNGGLLRFQQVLV